MKKELHQRPKYLKEALLFRDTDLVKVVTGIRRCGKSSLLELVREHIEAEHVPGRSFVSVNLEQRGLGIRDDDDLYSYISQHMDSDGTTYVFIDEVQRVEKWHDVVNSLRVEYDCDIYLTGSNALLLSGELATYLSGRYVEVKMLPLAFSEYADFCGLRFSGESTAALLEDGRIATFDDVFRRYLDFGGMPAIATLDTTQDVHSHYMEGLYNTVVVRDVMGRGRGEGRRKTTDPGLVEAVCEYLADTIGRTASAKKVADALTAGGRKTGHTTVAAYMDALASAYIVYPCTRYDIHGKAMLKTAPKHYLVDTGLRRYLSGYRGGDAGFVFENAVYLQLLFGGWSVHVGKLYQAEVDFIAVKDGRVVYIQAADEMFSEETRRRELAPLKAIHDAHEKVVVVRQGDESGDVDGIRIVRARDLFL